MNARGALASPLATDSRYFKRSLRDEIDEGLARLRIAVLPVENDHALHADAVDEHRAQALEPYASVALYSAIRPQTTTRP